MTRLVAAAALITVLAVFSNGARAHSFNVALIIAKPSTADIRQARDGFLLATRERDSHPDEESDGHLGGLDVYLYPVDLEREALSGLRALLQREQIDILAVIGPDKAVAEIEPLVVDSPTVLLAPGRLRSSSREDFTATFEAAFGYPPTATAVEGYNAARRIDAAIRPQGGVGDRAALRQALDETRNGLDW